MNTPTRWLRHLWLDAADARRQITPAGLERLESLVVASESRHRGELRLCVEGGLPVGALWAGVSSRARAIDLFSHLRVWDTEHSNGVLIYLLMAERRIEILADRGLSEKVPASTWQSIVDTLANHIQGERFEEGLSQAVQLVGALMQEHYPLLSRAPHNPNELPDAVVLI